MTAEEFKSWLWLMSYSDTEAAKELGIGSRNTIARYRASGAPLYIGFACAARSMSAEPWASVNPEKDYALYEARVAQKDGTWSKTWTVRATDLPQALYRFGALMEDANSSSIQVRLVDPANEVDYGHDVRAHFNVFEHSEIRWDRVL